MGVTRFETRRCNGEGYGGKSRVGGEGMECLACSGVEVDSLVGVWDLEADGAVGAGGGRVSELVWFGMERALDGYGRHAVKIMHFRIPKTVV